MIFVIEVWSPSRQAWKPTGNLRDTHEDAVRVLEKLTAVYPGKRRRVQPYEISKPASTLTTEPRRHA